MPSIICSKDTQSFDGYVSDSLYPSNFHQSFQPPWTDWILERHALVPPRGAGAPFTLVDLGCGDGLGLIVTAAAHPQGRFVGIDVSPDHVARGTALISQAGLENISLHCLDFLSARSLADGAADYVTAQGVLAWVSETNRQALLDLAAAWLAPGGAFTVGYNSYPGWGQVAAFQRLVRAIALNEQGDSAQRFAAAVEKTRAAGVFDSSIWEWIDPLLERFPANYFAHEYLNGHWNPCWSGDVITAASEHGMTLVGQATAARLRKDLYYKKKWQDSMATMPDIASQEIAADILSHTWYRQDVYIMGQPQHRQDRPALDAIMARQWIMPPAPGGITQYSTSTPAGVVSFDNAAARAIMALLADGPASLADLPALTEGDRLNSIDALFMAGIVIPCDPADDPQAATRLNNMLAGQDFPINALSGRHGAIGISPHELPAYDPDDRLRMGLADSWPDTAGRAQSAQ